MNEPLRADQAKDLLRTADSLRWLVTQVEKGCPIYVKNPLLCGPICAAAKTLLARIDALLAEDTAFEKARAADQEKRK